MDLQQSDFQFTIYICNTLAMPLPFEYYYDVFMARVRIIAQLWAFIRIIIIEILIVHLCMRSMFYVQCPLSVYLVYGKMDPINAHLYSNYYHFGFIDSIP